MCIKKIISADITILAYDYYPDYRIVGKFGRGKVWQIDSFRAFSESKSGELINQPIDY